MKAPPSVYEDAARAAEAGGRYGEAVRLYSSAAAASIGHTRREMYRNAQTPLIAKAKAAGQDWQGYGEV